MAKETRRTWTDEEKQKHIEEHKAAYISNKRAKINGKPATEELFNALPINEQWDKIKGRLPKPEGQAKRAKTPYQEVRIRLNYVKRTVDKLTDDQMEKVNELIEDIKKANETREERKTEQEKKARLVRREEILKELAELDKLDNN